jgi:hypothetical protein
MITVYEYGDYELYSAARKEIRKRGITFNENMIGDNHKEFAMVLYDFANVFAERVAYEIMAEVFDTVYTRSA